jgi:hypothetical protein
VFNVRTTTSLLPRQQMATVPPERTSSTGAASRGHLWDLQETRRYSVPPTNMLAFSEYLQHNNWSIKSFDNKQLKAVGATTPNVNWKARLYYSWTQESPNSYLVHLRSAAKWKPVTSLVVGVLTAGIGWIVGAATFTGHIVQAEKEFNQMWGEIERSIGANLGVVNQQGFGLHNPSIPQEYQQELQRQQQLQQQQAAGGSYMPAPGVQQPVQLAQPVSNVPQSMQSTATTFPPAVQQTIVPPTVSQTAQQVLPMEKMPTAGASVGGEEVQQVYFEQVTQTTTK